MSTGRNSPGSRREAFQRDVVKMSSIDLLGVLATQLLVLEGSVGGPRPWRTKQAVLERCQIIVSELRRREQQTHLF